VGVATVEECEAALHTLAERMAANDPSRRPTGFDRSLTCTVRDLQVTFGGHLKDGLLTDIQRVDDPQADIRLDLSGDDLLAMVAGDLNVASAWANGRLKIGARPMDLLRLRSVL
jgi:alkyl sulfatase BDS1-like metallo-beta-lactamase superfamily hydrolase